MAWNIITNALPFPFINFKNLYLTFPYKVEYFTLHELLKPESLSVKTI